MRKNIYFILGLLLGISFFYWLNEYSTLNKEDRIGFLPFVLKDSQIKLQGAYSKIESIPEIISTLVKARSSIVDALANQLQKAIEAYYLVNGEYPKSLDDIIDKAQLPLDMRIIYIRQREGYVLWIYDKEGELIGAFSEL